MSKEIALKQNGLWTQEYEQLIIDTYCKGATKMEATLFLNTCKRTGLEPGKQIYAVKRWDSGLKREVMTVQTGIDGYRLIAERTGCYAPGREPTFTYDKEGNLISATAYVKKMTKDGTWHEVASTAFYAEYVQKNKEGVPTKFWRDMPHGQLAKCAEALDLRKCFPGEYDRLYTIEEMAQASNGQIEETEEPELSQEEIEIYLATYGVEKENFCEWVQKISTAKSMTIDKTIRECIKNPEKTKKCFVSWLEKQNPIEIAQGE